MAEKFVVTPQKLRENAENWKKQKADEREARVKQFLLNEIPKIEEKLLAASYKGNTCYEWLCDGTESFLIRAVEDYLKAAEFKVTDLINRNDYPCGLRIDW